MNMGQEDSGLDIGMVRWEGIGEAIWRGMASAEMADAILKLFDLRQSRYLGEEVAPDEV